MIGSILSSLLSKEPLIMAILAVVAILLLFIYINTFMTRKAVKRVLRDNNLLIENETKIWMISNGTIVVNNYRRRTDQEFDRFIEILEAERKQRYYYQRKDSVLTIKKFPEAPKEKGIYLQSVKNGEIKRYKPHQQINGILVAGRTGSGKSVLVEKLLEQNSYSELLIISPKGDEDFKEGIMPDADAEALILEMIDKAKAGHYKGKAPGIIVLDEIITLSKIFKKDTIEKINIALTIIRSQNLRFIVCTQKLNKTSASADISLLSVKILNVADIKNFYESLGIERLKTSPEALKVGEFIFYMEGEEYILINQLGGVK